ncbi:MAG TPA: methyltransferase domain-containing protein [Gammaproteobacteria bacterium]|jgi:2-polyprenyl-3-methyl-5-hydroxy-6-metoxy-1,4-benzoquinol methylase|nr:methyltransferase domain-containing protein [Gammaproteobacteria bacterium]
MSAELSSYGKERLTIVDHFGVYLSLRAIQKYLPKNPQLKVLDLGCGYHATLLSALSTRIHSGIGVDFHIHPALKKISNLTFIESSIQHVFPKLSTPVDVIFLMSTLEHLAEPLDILHQCHQLLEKNGMLFVNVPTWRGKFFLEFSAYRLGLSPKDGVDDHKMYYDKRDLWPLLVKSGFLPSQITLKYHKFGLNLLAMVRK